MRDNIRTIKKVITKLLLFVIFFAFSNPSAHAQKKNDNRISFSLNKIYIYSGGGDNGGFAFTTGVNRFLSNILNASLEYRFAHALKKPNFIIQFSEKSVHYFEAKVEIYPLNKIQSIEVKKIIGGIHIGIGPGFYFGTVSEETSWISYLDSNGIEVDRESRLGFKSISDFGFVVKIGYEKYITKRIYLGGRIDWSAYLNDDGYAGYGLIIGVKL